jgi:ATP-binding protein involved in chromosome partitioning
MGDEGKPIVEANPQHEISKIYLDFANKIKSTYL